MGELFGNGHHITGLARGNQFGQGAEDQAVIGPVKIIGRDHVADLVPRGRINQQPAKDGLFRLNRMRRLQRIVTRRGLRTART